MGERRHHWTVHPQHAQRMRRSVYSTPRTHVTARPQRQLRTWPKQKLRKKLMERPRARPAERAGSGVTSLAESSPSGPQDQANPATNTQMTICSRNQEKVFRDGFACQAGGGRSQHAFATLPPPLLLLLLSLSAQAAASKHRQHPCNPLTASCSAPARPGPLPLAELPCCIGQSRRPVAPLSPTAGQQGGGGSARACNSLS